MIVEFGEEYLRDLYTKGECSDKKHRYRVYVIQDMIANNLIPFEPTHPGELIKDELEANGLTQAKLAESIGVKPSLLNEIIKGKRGVNTEMALLIEAALNIPADLLLNLQSDYNMQMAKSDASFMKRLSSIRNIASML